MSDAVDVTLEAEQAISDLLVTLQQLKERGTQHANAEKAHKAAAGDLSEARKQLTSVTGSLEECAQMAESVLKALRDIGTPRILDRVDALNIRVSDAVTAIECLQGILEQATKRSEQAQARVQQSLEKAEKQVQALLDLPMAVNGTLAKAFADMSARQEQIINRLAGSRLATLKNIAVATLVCAFIALALSGVAVMKISGLLK